ncbi:hypothetical protein [Bacillus infantis]|nr:hypothetical protein [Bacillus infantis]
MEIKVNCPCCNEEITVHIVENKVEVSSQVNNEKEILSRLNIELG